MAFRRISGVLGKVYVPDGSALRKHNCPDCYRCQMCSDDRCRCCLSLKADSRQKKHRSGKKTKS